MSDDIDPSAEPIYRFYIEEGVGQIHRWFVENVQNGEDADGNSHIERATPEELLAAVRTVLASVNLEEEDALLIRGPLEGLVTSCYTK